MTPCPGLRMFQSGDGKEMRPKVQGKAFINRVPLLAFLIDVACKIGTRHSTLLSGSGVPREAIADDSSHHDNFLPRGHSR